MLDKLEGLAKDYNQHNDKKCGKAYLQPYVQRAGENKDKSTVEKPYYWLW